MPAATRPAPRRRPFLAAAALAVLASIGWVAFGDGREDPVAPPPAPLAPPLPADEPLAVAPAAAEPAPLPGDGPLLAELRYLGENNAADTLVVRRGVLSGHVLGDRGEPLADAVLTVRGGPSDGVRAVTDASGGYRMLGLLPGTHLFEIRVGAIHAGRQQRVLARNETRRDFVVGLAVPLQLELRGVENKPLAGARVAVDLGAQEGVSGEDGRVYFPTVPRGSRVLVEVRAGGHVPLRLELNLMPRASGVEPVVVQVPAGGRVRGQVRSWPGPPLPLVTVVPREDRPDSYSVAWDTWHQVPIEPDGWFVLEGLPATRTVDIRVFHPRGVSDPAMRTVRPGLASPATVVFNVLREDTRIAGRVVGPRDEPLAGAKVVLEASDPTAVLGRLYPGLAEGPVSAVLPTPAALRRELVTGPDGSFDFDYGDHPPGSGNLVLRAEKDGYAPAASLVKNARTSYRLQLRPVERDAALALLPEDALPPVEWYLDGARQPAAGALLDGLRRGSYELTVKRGDRVLVGPEVLELRGRVEVRLR